ncbi:class C sortase [Enterococcus sp. LJL90]
MKKSSVSYILIYLFLLFLILIGGLLVSYPLYREALGQFFDQQILQEYQDQAYQQNQQKVATLQEKEKENRELALNGNLPGFSGDPFSEERSGPNPVERSYLLEHLIGRVYLPSIQAETLLFDTTNDTLLDRGATLLEGTSFPIGGKSTHTAISAHRGLAEKKLFTDLPDLTIGDQFIIEVYGEKRAYQVDQIKTVLPDDIKDLLISPVEDLATLITCTPYLINSHRLLVRGHRIPYSEALAKSISDSSRMVAQKSWLILGGLIGFLLLLLYLIWRSLRIFLLRRQQCRIEFCLLTGNKRPRQKIVFEVLDTKQRPFYRKGHVLKIRTDQKGLASIIIPKDKYILREVKSGKLFRVNSRKKAAAKHYLQTKDYQLQLRKIPCLLSLKKDQV